MDPIVRDNLHPINSAQEGTTIMANGWIRIRSAAAVNAYRRRINNIDSSTWLAQAHDIFNRLGITRGFEHFRSIFGIQYYLNLLGPTDNLSFGYLFLCPLAELQAEDPTCFRIADCIAYWSLDPSGVNRLSQEMAEDLGFPAINFNIAVEVLSWDASVYDGICQFQKAKGFDPYSQEVALELGDSLLQIFCGQGTLLAHLQQSDEDDSYSDSDGYAENCSESGDEQYDSANSELGDGFPIQKQNIDSVFRDAMEDHPSEDNVIPTANEDPSRVLDESDASSHQCCALEEAELLAPSWSFNIFMAMQSVLILTATALSLPLPESHLRRIKNVWARRILGSLGSDPAEGATLRPGVLNIVQLAAVIFEKLKLKSLSIQPDLRTCGRGAVLRKLISEKNDSKYWGNVDKKLANVRDKHPDPGQQSKFVSGAYIYAGSRPANIWVGQPQFCPPVAVPIADPSTASTSTASVGEDDGDD
ncbi:hypothetical protein B0H13DRAFT_2360188 [Mycena leptocephala]|nr:hypothetical protein B0H13DRAFT_2360188 [Mycena leptocephala]